MACLSNAREFPFDHNRRADEGRLTASSLRALGVSISATSWEKYWETWILLRCVRLHTGSAVQVAGTANPNSRLLDAKSNIMDTNPKVIVRPDDAP